jgi:4-hydroxy-3-methylbut-2-enyl diphosphate reductase
MKIKLAKAAGFCMGVKRAMEIAFFEANKKDDKLFTYGPLIHNQQVLDLLSNKGVNIITEIDDEEKGRIIIRAHGVSPGEKKKLEESKFQVIDATCPRVLKVQAIIKKYNNMGYIPVIYGDLKHPEVVGLMGYSSGNGIVVNSVDNIEESLGKDKKRRFVVVSQTTQDAEAYNKFTKIIKELYTESITFDTVCDETYKRQGEAKTLASEVDCMVVVGGKNSGNTKRLYEISKSMGKPAFHIETEKEIEGSWFEFVNNIGVTAGASTPNWMIKRVIERLRAMTNGKHYYLKNIAGKIFPFINKTTITESIGAFSLTYAGIALTGGKKSFIYPIIAMLYVYGMHVLNRFLDKEVNKYNDPGMAIFYSKNKGFLVISSLAGIFAGLILSLSLGFIQLLLFAGLTMLGLAYSIPIIPWKSKYLGRYSKIKDLPGSKDLTEALAWGTISSFLPVIGADRIFWPGVFTSFFFVSSMCYIRTGFFNILNIQGDIIVGKETLPIALGEKRAFNLLMLANSVFTIVLLLAAITGVVTKLGYLLVFCFIVSFYYLIAYKKIFIRDEYILKGIVEFNLLLAGIVAFIWGLY